MNEGYILSGAILFKKFFMLRLRGFVIAVVAVFFLQYRIFKIKK